MGRSSRLALGAIAAAVAAGRIGPTHIGAAIALARAGVLLLHRLRPALQAGTLVPITVGAAVIALRLLIAHPAADLPSTPPDGNGPWTMTVIATVSPREGQQVATLTSVPGAGIDM